MKASLAFACVLAFSGCAFSPSPGDRMFAARDFVAARDAYTEVLQTHDDGRRVESALYHLGLIYLQPNRELYDPKAAEAALTRLTYLRPRSAYAAKASLLLALQRDSAKLSAAVRSQVVMQLEAQDRLESLREEATQTEARSEDQSKKVGQLGNRIAGLQAQIVKLREELAATEDELSEREQELDRLKKIDLEEPGSAFR